MIFAIESPQSSRAPHFCVSASPLLTTKARLSISSRLSFSSEAVQHTAFNCVNSCFFTFLRTLSRPAKSYVLSFHAIPHSLPKTRGVGIPSSSRLQFLRRSQYLPLSSRWSPVALPWKIRSISFSFMPLHDFSFQNDEGVHPPSRPSLPSVLTLCLGDSVAIPSLLFATLPKNGGGWGVFS